MPKLEIPGFKQIFKSSDSDKASSSHKQSDSSKDMIIPKVPVQAEEEKKEALPVPDPKTVKSEESKDNQYSYENQLSRISEKNESQYPHTPASNNASGNLQQVPNSISAQ